MVVVYAAARTGTPTPTEEALEVQAFGPTTSHGTSWRSGATVARCATTLTQRRRTPPPQARPDRPPRARRSLAVVAATFAGALRRAGHVHAGAGALGRRDPICRSSPGTGRARPLRAAGRLGRAVRGRSGCRCGCTSTCGPSTATRVRASREGGRLRRRRTCAPRRATRSPRYLRALIGIVLAERGAAPACSSRSPSATAPGRGCATRSPPRRRDRAGDRRRARRPPPAARRRSTSRSTTRSAPTSRARWRRSRPPSSRRRRSTRSSTRSSSASRGSSRDPPSARRSPTGRAITIASDLHNNFLALADPRARDDDGPLFFAGDLTDRGSPLEARLVRRVVRRRPAVRVRLRQPRLRQPRARPRPARRDRADRARAAERRTARYGDTIVDVAGAARRRLQRPVRAPRRRELQATATTARAEHRAAGRVHRLAAAAARQGRRRHGPRAGADRARARDAQGRPARARRSCSSSATRTTPSSSASAGVTVVNGGSVGAGGTGNLTEPTDYGIARLIYTTKPAFQPLAADLVSIDPGSGSATARRERLDAAVDGLSSLPSSTARDHHVDGPDHDRRAHHRPEPAGLEVRTTQSVTSSMSTLTKK